MLILIMVLILAILSSRHSWSKGTGDPSCLGNMLFGSPGHGPAGGVDEEVCELPRDVGQRQQPQLVHRHRPQPHGAESY